MHLFCSVLFLPELRDSAIDICYKDIVMLSSVASPRGDLMKNVIGYILLLLGMKNSWDVAKTSIFKVCPFV